jgi:hypothetical protein
MPWKTPCERGELPESPERAITYRKFGQRSGSGVGAWMEGARVKRMGAMK